MTTDTTKTAQAAIKNLNVAPRKARLVAGLIKGRPAIAALVQLQMINNRASYPIAKLIRSAMSNARNKNLDPNKLVIANITVDEGQALKRTLPKGRGHMSLVEKKHSHVNLVLREDQTVVASGVVLPEKPKKVRESRQPREGKARPDFKEKPEEIKKRKKSGFVNRLFRRKSI